jgi:hypothetical protein
MSNDDLPRMGRDELLAEVTRLREAVQIGAKVNRELAEQRDMWKRIARGGEEAPK